MLMPFLMIFPAYQFGQVHFTLYLAFLSVCPPSGLASPSVSLLLGGGGLSEWVPQAPAVTPLFSLPLLVL